MVKATSYSDAAAVAPAKTDCQNSVSVDLATSVTFRGTAETGPAAQPTRSRSESARAASLPVFIFALLPYLGHPNGHGGAHIGLGIDGDAVALAKVDFQPVIDIFNADAGVVAALLAQNGLNLFLLHAHAVVGHGEDHVGAVGAEGNDDLALVHQAVDPVVDGVFDDGLEGDLVTEEVQAALIHVEAVGELVFIPVLLNFEVALGVAQLRADGDELVTPADADAEELRQGVDHLHSLVVAPL